MARIRTPARHLSLLLVAFLGGGACSAGSSGAEIAPLVQAEAAAAVSSAAASGEPQSIDCAGNPRALWEAEASIQHRDGDELHQYWLLADQPDLWDTVVPVFESLTRYREQVRKILPDTSPLGLIRSNRHLNSWLEREYPAEGRISRLVEAGVGWHRPMNCLESHLLAYQAARFPLYEQPSEIVALIVKRSEVSGDLGDLVKVYIAADDDAIVPKPNWAIESVEIDVAEGWRFHAVFHNHTFDHSDERSLVPVAAPSASDLEVSVALNERLGLEYVLVTDGFSTLELTPEEFRKLERAARSTGESDQVAK